MVQEREAVQNPQYGNNDGPQTLSADLKYSILLWAPLPTSCSTSSIRGISVAHPITQVRGYRIPRLLFHARFRESVQAEQGNRADAS